MDQQLFDKNLSQEISRMCEVALAEDLGGDHSPDITAELIDPDSVATAQLISKETAIFCGSRWLETIYKILGDQVSVEWHIKDGDLIKANQVICKLEGNARQLLTGERSAMNFIQTLSATATTTHNFSKLIQNTGCEILDTRKTIPGMRFGQKYAVTVGGGLNHRMGLSDAFLIKENHIMACGGLLKALKKAYEIHPDKLIEIEVENIEELKLAIQGRAQVIMLDNFELPLIEEAIEIRNQSSHKPKLEASGNVNTKTIKPLAKLGVDFISIGALTKDIKAVDLSMRIKIS